MYRCGKEPRRMVLCFPGRNLCTSSTFNKGKREGISCKNAIFQLDLVFVQLGSEIHLRYVTDRKF